jgi:multiple sugar transport system ATP-binding protein
MRGEVAGLHERLGTTIVYVTHDQVEAMTLGQRIAVLRDGALQQYAPPLEVYRAPANLFVAGFIGTPAINTAGGEVTAGGMFETAGLRLALLGRWPAGPATLALRPEALSVATNGSAAADLTATVRRLEPLGSELLAHVEGPGGAPWIARLAPDAAVAAGRPVALGLDRARLHLFGPDGRRLERQRVGGLASSG